ncbi:MAG: hypothetical protein GF335_04730 [Candidatus Moranbacteria bacterium]|nr:hypothetical protein [Candidatus Moranbacteria bacterium]
MNQKKFPIIPSMDIKNGRLSRISAKFLNNNPNKHLNPFFWIEKFNKLGINYLHLVDLDAALNKKTKNFPLVKQIIKSSQLKIEISAGIKTRQDIEKYLELNPWQIILSSASVFNEKFIKNTLKQFKSNQITLSVDYNQGFAASRGNIKKSKIKISTLAEKLSQLDIKRYIFTDVSKDGKLSGANLKAAQKFKETVRSKVLISGGVKSNKEIQTIKNSSLDGCIIGKAIYENKIDLQKIL